MTSFTSRFFEINTQREDYAQLLHGVSEQAISLLVALETMSKDTMSSVSTDYYAYPAHVLDSDIHTIHYLLDQIDTLSQDIYTKAPIMQTIYNYVMRYLIPSNADTVEMWFKILSISLRKELPFINADNSTYAALRAMHLAGRKHSDARLRILTDVVKEISFNQWLAYIMLPLGLDTLELWQSITSRLSNLSLFYTAITYMLQHERTIHDRRVFFLVHQLFYTAVQKNDIKIIFMMLRQLLRVLDTEGDAFILERLQGIPNFHETAFRDNENTKTLLLLLRQELKLKDYIKCTQFIDSRFIVRVGPAQTLEPLPDIFGERLMLPTTQVATIWMQPSWYTTQHNLPPALFDQIRQEPSEEACLSILHAYAHFVQKYQAINDATDPQHHRDFLLFLSIHQIIIAQFVHIMGERAFEYLEKYLIATDTLTLDRLLTHMPGLSEATADRMKDLFSQEKTFPTSYKKWEKLLNMMGLLDILEIKIREECFGENLTGWDTMMHNLASMSLDDVMQNLDKTFIQSVCVFLGVDELREESILPLMQHLPKIVFAHLHMQEDEYREIFRQMLQCDLSGQSVVAWMHDERAENSDEGRLLAAHNRRIQETLSQSGIDVSCALNYPVQRSFHLPKSQRASQQVIFDALGKDLEELIKRSAFNTKLQLNLKQLLGNLNSKKKTFDSSNFVNKSLISAIRNKIKHIEEKTVFETPTQRTDFLEYAGHFEERVRTLKTPDVEIDTTQTFTVQQWNKDQLSTYWLGNDVGCCLATDGEQFPALIQRRMDDAMLFHVVVGENPIALSWLYFAYDLIKPNEIYVIANFIEIASNYAHNADMQRCIISHLLHFTGEYCAKIGAKAYLINHLDYGWISNFNCFDQQALHPQKVGGYLSLNETSQHETECYYLNSLNRNQFHLYHAHRFPPTFGPTTAGSLSLFAHSETEKGCMKKQRTISIPNHSPS